METKKQKSKYKNLIWSIVFIFLVVFTVRMIISQSEGLSPKQFWQMIRSSNPAWLISGIISAGLFVWFEGVALCSILKGIGYSSKLRQGFLYSTSDIYFSAITPSATGGQPASAYFMLRDGIPGGVVTATLILNLMMYTISIVILGLFSIVLNPWAFFTFSLPAKVFIGIGFVALTALALIFLLILKKGNWIFDLTARIVQFLCRKHLLHGEKRKLAKIEKARSDYMECASLFSGRPHLMGKALFWNLLQRASQMIVPVYLYFAMHGDAKNGFVIFAKQCLVTIGFNFVPIPGGMGISDYLMLDGFRGLMSRDMAFQLELLSRGITFYICVTISGIITLIGYLAGRKKHDRSL